MKKIVFSFLSLFFAGLIMAQSVGEVARQDRERRAKSKPSRRVYTNDDLKRLQRGAVTIVTLPQAEAAQGQALGSSDKRGEDLKPTDLKGRDEAYWRNTMREARQKVKELENKATELELRRNDLFNRFYREQDVVAREKLQVEIQKTLFEMDQNRMELEAARRALEDLRLEARKSNAPPGWLR